MAKKFTFFTERKILINTTERKNYIERHYAALHTVSGYYPKELDLDMFKDHPLINKPSIKKARNKDEKITSLQINPNKKIGESMFRTYSEWKKVFDDAFADLGLDSNEFVMKRADLSFNSENSEDYERFNKLHRALMCCTSITYSFKNNYQTNDLWTLKSRSINIRKDDTEAENYNKKIENPKSPVKNRFELRSKKIHEKSSLEHEFTERWIKRLEKSIVNYDAVQQRYNDSLEALYKEDLQKPKKYRAYVSLTAFILQYKDCIFSSKQMTDLLTRLGVKNAKDKARKLKSKYAIEYISYTDLKVVVAGLKKSVKDYFKK